MPQAIGLESECVKFYTPVPDTVL